MLLFGFLSEFPKIRIIICFFQVYNHKLSVFLEAGYLWINYKLGILFSYMGFMKDLERWLQRIMNIIPCIFGCPLWVGDFSKSSIFQRKMTAISVFIEDHYAFIYGSHTQYMCWVIFYRALFQIQILIWMKSKTLMDLWFIVSIYCMTDRSMRPCLLFSMISNSFFS